MVLQTPKRQPLSKSLSSGSLDNLDGGPELTKGCPEEIIRQGGLVLYCDYVVMPLGEVRCLDKG